METFKQYMQRFWEAGAAANPARGAANNSRTVNPNNTSEPLAGGLGHNYLWGARRRASFDLQNPAQAEDYFTQIIKNVDASCNTGEIISAQHSDRNKILYTPDEIDRLGFPAYTIQQRPSRWAIPEQQFLLSFGILKAAEGVGYSPETLKYLDITQIAPFVKGDLNPHDVPIILRDNSQTTLDKLLDELELRRNQGYWFDTDAIVSAEERIRNMFFRQQSLQGGVGLVHQGWDTMMGAANRGIIQDRATQGFKI